MEHIFIFLKKGTPFNAAYIAMNKTKITALICAAAISLTSCANININHDSTEVTTTSPPVSSAVTTTTSDNVPQFTVAPDTSEEAVTSSVPVTTPPEVVTSLPTSSSEAQTNASGEIIDDYRSELDMSVEDPDELYRMFGLSRTERQQFYSEISSEYDLPIIHVSTENEQEVLSKEEYVNCIVEIFNCEEEYVMDATSAGIRVRGNASAFYGDEDKIRENGAPYRIKFTSKQSVLGLNNNAKCKSWVLLRTYEAGIRDYLAFMLAKAINDGDYFSSDARFVELYLNEKFIGLYLLCEQSQENPNRVAINECDEGYTGTDIGYLVELDNYSYTEQWRFMLNYNKESITDVYGTSRVPISYYYTVKNDIYSDEQLKFIERYFEVAYEIPMRAIKYGEFYRLNDDMTLTLAQDEFANAYECVSQVLNVDSFVDMYMVHEITNNQDVGGGSFYFAVDFGDISLYKTLTCVCPWDFDWSYADYYSSSDGGLYVAKFKDSNFVENYGDRSNPWLILLYSADWFQELVREKWAERYPYILQCLSDVENVVETYKDDFNKSESSRYSRANSILDWASSRVEYLNELWG